MTVQTAARPAASPQTPPLPEAKPEKLGLSSGRLQKMSDAFKREVDKGTVPGVTIMVARRGQIGWFDAIGRQNPATAAPMAHNSIFRVFSMTKPIVSVAIMMLLEDGDLLLTDPVAKYIPSFVTVQVGIETKDKDGKPVLRRVTPKRPPTIADLLRHTSGITYEYIGGDLIKQAYVVGHIFDGPFDNKTFADRIAKLPLSRQPGTLWRYGHSTDVLGRVIEVVSGQTLYEFEKSHIFDPLRMTSTKYVLDDDAERARMAEPLPSDTILLDAERQRRAHPEWQSGGGGLVSTATDYARFAQMILNGGTFGGKRYLSPKAFKLMTTDRIGPRSGVDRDYFYFPGDGFGFGYGFAVRVAPGEAKPPAAGSIGELKWDSGSGTYFGVDPKLDMVFILMEQTQNERGRITPAFKALVYRAFGK